MNRRLAERGQRRPEVRGSLARAGDRPAVEHEHAARAVGHRVAVGPDERHRLVGETDAREGRAGGPVEEREPLVEKRHEHHAPARGRRPEAAVGGRAPDLLAVADRHEMILLVLDHVVGAVPIGGEAEERPRHGRVRPAHAAVAGIARHQRPAFAGDDLARPHHHPRGDVGRDLEAALAGGEIPAHELCVLGDEVSGRRRRSRRRRLRGQRARERLYPGLDAGEVELVDAADARARMMARRRSFAASDRSEFFAEVLAECEDAVV